VARPCGDRAADGVAQRDNFHPFEMTEKDENP
jgi:hypothetical protein